MFWTLKSKTYKITLGEEEQEITQSSVMPYFKSIQIINDTESEVIIRKNSDEDSLALPVGEGFELTSDKQNEPRADVVYARGTGEITVELDYYESEGI